VRAKRFSGLAVIAVGLLAAALRLWAIGSVPGNTFYDAAVHSMGHSWHDFFFGALEPAGSLSIDKPPLDLWLQVSSTQLLGFNQTALHLPEALAGVATSLLLFGVLARSFGLGAALVGGLLQATLPISVLTARSDTMDCVLVALCVAALWCSFLALERRQRRWMLLAALIMGVAFNVKLTEALIVLPALALLWWWASPKDLWGKTSALAGTTAVLLTTSLCWVAVASLTALSGRPFPVGSHNGSIWRLVFVFNGLQRLGSGRSLGKTSGHGVVAPGPLRMLDSGASHNATRVGLAVLLALLLAALALTLTRRRAASTMTQTQTRLAIAVGIWLVFGVVLLSSITHLEPRYLEILTPAVSATLGIAVCSLLRRGQNVLRVIIAVLILALLSVSLVTDVQLIGAKRSDSILGDPVSGATAHYLHAHRADARFEVASATVFDITGVIARDGLPVLILNDIDGSIVRSSTLASLVRAGQVRLYFAAHGCHTGIHCPANERWAYAHSTPVGGYRGLRRFQATTSARRRLEGAG
jgi:4-amino-4-deoxy-L-arabinose transferase-like glycosyltransferase